MHLQSFTEFLILTSKHTANLFSNMSCHVKAGYHILTTCQTVTKTRTHNLKCQGTILPDQLTTKLHLFIKFPYFCLTFLYAFQLHIAHLLKSPFAFYFTINQNHSSHTLNNESSHGQVMFICIVLKSSHVHSNKI